MPSTNSLLTVMRLTDTLLAQRKAIFDHLDNLAEFRPELALAAASLKDFLKIYLELPTNQLMEYSTETARFRTPTALRQIERNRQAVRDHRAKLNPDAAHRARLPKLPTESPDVELKDLYQQGAEMLHQSPDHEAPAGSKPQIFPNK